MSIINAKTEIRNYKQQFMIIIKSAKVYSWRVIIYLFKRKKNKIKNEFPKNTNLTKIMIKILQEN